MVLVGRRKKKITGWRDELFAASTVFLVRVVNPVFFGNHGSRQPVAGFVVVLYFFKTFAARLDVLIGFPAQLSSPAGGQKQFVVTRLEHLAHFLLDTLGSRNDPFELCLFFLVLLFFRCSVFRIEIIQEYRIHLFELVVDVGKFTEVVNLVQSFERTHGHLSVHGQETGQHTHDPIPQARQLVVARPGSQLANFYEFLSFGFGLRAVQFLGDMRRLLTDGHKKVPELVLVGLDVLLPQLRPAEIVGANRVGHFSDFGLLHPSDILEPVIKVMEITDRIPARYLLATARVLEFGSEIQVNGFVYGNAFLEFLAEFDACPQELQGGLALVRNGDVQFEQFFFFEYILPGILFDHLRQRQFETIGKKLFDHFHNLGGTVNLPLAGQGSENHVQDSHRQLGRGDRHEDAHNDAVFGACGMIFRLGVLHLHGNLGKTSDFQLDTPAPLARLVFGDVFDRLAVFVFHDEKLRFLFGPRKPEADGRKKFHVDLGA